MKKSRIPLLSNIQACQGRHEIPMDQFYRHVGINRQGYRRGLRAYETELNVMREVEKKVAVYRSKDDRRAGSRSLYYNLSIKAEFGFGVNKF